MPSSQTAYEDYRSLLFPIALRTLGNEEDAEDLVQETLLKWLLRPSTKQIANPKGYLVRTLINKCLNFIRDHQKESKHEITPELLIDIPHSNIEHVHLLSASFRMLFEMLNPIERAVFLLKEVFHYSHREISELLEITEEHSRQILTRARRRLKAREIRFEVETEEHSELYQKFMEVCDGSDFGALLKLLQEDVAHYRLEPTASLQPVMGKVPVTPSTILSKSALLHLATPISLN